MTTGNAAQAFINVGERTNVTGSAKFRKLIEQNDYPAALAVARRPRAGYQGPVAQAVPARGLVALVARPS